MKLNEIIRYFSRFLILQIILTLLTIFYFDNFLIGDYQRGYELIIFNLIEDRDRFYTFIPNSLIKLICFLDSLSLFF